VGAYLNEKGLTVSFCTTAGFGEADVEHLSGSVRRTLDVHG
jgi:hypothetical protein